MAKRSTAQSLTIPPSVGGWNTRDPISAMGPEYAVEMDNYFPNMASVDLVNGYRYHSKGVGTGVVGLVANLDTSGTSYLLAAGSTTGPTAYKVYNATTASAAATDITGAATLTDPVIFSQQFKQLLYISSGSATDELYKWSGTGNIVTSGFTSGGSAVTGVGPMTTYKGRFYCSFFRGSSPPFPGYTNISYGPIDASSGALTSLELESVFRNGGFIIFIGSVTRAKDFSEDELFCIILTTGEILIYEGDYPTSNSWRLLARYQIPRPLGPRAFFYIGANLCIITSQGVIPMSEIMGGTAGGRYLGLSDAIASSFSSVATTALLNDTAWCGVNYPRGNFAVTNIPITSGSVSHQYYMNTLSQAWCRRTNQNAFSWTLFNDELYFGGLSGRVFKADNGYFDENPASEGAALSRSCKLRPAYNYLGDRVGNKHFVAVRPLMKESEGLNITVNADVDFNDTAGTDAVTDTADTSYKRYRPDVDCNTIGKCVSVRFDDTVTTKRRSIEAIDIFWREGDII